MDNKLTIQQDPEKKKTLDFKSKILLIKKLFKEFIENKFKTNRILETQDKYNNDSFGSQDLIKNENNEELLFIDSTTENNKNNLFVKSKFKLDFKNLDKFKHEEEIFENERNLEEKDITKKNKKNTELNFNLKISKK